MRCYMQAKEDDFLQDLLQRLEPKSKKGKKKRRIEHA